MKIKSEKVYPSARRLIQSLRGLGYNPETAIADLVDNSVNADATEIYVNVFAKEGKTPAHIYISDNGDGMDREELREAMRYGSGVEYSLDDLGRFGLGLKTASLSQCSILTVSSRPKAKAGTRSRKLIARWDLKHVYHVDEWELQYPEVEQLEDWEAEILADKEGAKGWTTVLWSELTDQLLLLNSSDLKKREAFHAKVLADITKHLGSVFHMYLQGSVPDKRKVKIFVGGTEIKPWDPFCSSESKLRELSPFKPTVSQMEIDAKTRIVFKPYILPTESEFSSRKAFDNASGPKGWLSQQGFYFYRNYRLVKAGGWSRMRKPDEKIKYLRIGVFFSGEYDDKFSINITKMICNIPSELTTEIRNLASEWSSEANRRYRGKKTSEPSTQSKKGTEKPSPGPTSVRVGAVTMQTSPTQSGQLTVTKGSTPNSIKILIPQNHEFSSVFSQRDEITQLCIAMLAVLEAAAGGKIQPTRLPVETFKRKLRSLV